MTEPDDKQVEAYLAAVAGLVPATAQQVGAALGKLSNRLEELTQLLMEADTEATALAEEYQQEYDKAFILAGAKSVGGFTFEKRLPGCVCLLSSKKSVATRVSQLPLSQ